MISLNERDEIRRKIMALDDHLPKNLREHDIREKQIRKLKLNLDSLSHASVH